MAQELDTISYEIMCLISERVTRKYIRHNKVMKECNQRLINSNIQKTISFRTDIVFLLICKLNKKQFQDCYISEESLDFHSPILLKSQDLSHLNDVFLENIQETTLAGVRTFHASSTVFSIVRHEHVHSPQDHNQFFYKIRSILGRCEINILYKSVWNIYFGSEA